MMGFLRQPKPKPSLPDGMRIYAISDIHGRADLLENVFAAIDLHLARAGPARSLHVFWAIISIADRRLGKRSICWSTAAVATRASSQGQSRSVPV